MPRPRRFLRNNGLALVLGLMFLVLYLGGQLGVGWHAYNNERKDWHEPPVSLRAYLASPHFLEASAENWESEFLEMFIYVYITAFLFQKGSAESNDPDHPLPRRKVTASSPWPVRHGGLWAKLYSHSLSLVLATFFFVTFTLHAFASTWRENEQRLRHGQPPETVTAHIAGPQFWFESFQNWQSEFLAILCIVLLTIWLRERDSPESKAVEAPHSETG